MIYLKFKRHRRLKPAFLWLLEINVHLGPTAVDCFSRASEFPVIGDPEGRTHAMMNPGARETTNRLVRVWPAMED